MATFPDPHLAPLVARTGDRGARRVVWAGGLLLTAINLFYIAIFSRPVPIGDDFLVVAPMTGAVGLLRWCWEQYNYHRFPLAKLIFFCCLKLSHWDFRVPMVLSALLLGACGIGLAEAARHLRGKMRYTDLFFPLIFSHGGHAVNLLLAFNLNLVLPAFCITLTLFFVSQMRDPSRPAPVWQLAVCLVCLGMMGGFGLPFLLSFGCWFIYLGIRSAKLRGLSLISGFCVLGALALQFVTYKPPTDVPAIQSPTDSIRTGLEVLSTCFGTAAKKGWILTHGLTGALSLCLVVATAAVALRALGRDSTERPRVAGFLIFLAGLVGLMLGIGWSRAGFGPWYGFQARYTSLATPLLACMYLVAARYLPDRFKARTSLVLFIFAIGLYVAHIPPGIHFGHGEALMLDNFTNDVRAGVPREVLLERYTDQFLVKRAELNKDFQNLRAAGLEPFREIKD